MSYYGVKEDGAGEEVATGGDLRRVLRKHEPGDVVRVAFYRGAERYSVDVRLGEAAG